MENQELIKQVAEKAQRWLTPAYDAETQAEVKRMLENEDKTELIDCFYKDLEFGTGGLRGIMGAGTNRMNIYTVGAATQGLSNYLNKCFKDKEQISVVVGYDCRNNSDKFAQISADIFSANGIKVYLFDDLRPTPEVSFAIRHFGCQSGINITASHNPREYNGYKAYWDDGAQVLAPHDTAIIDEVNKVTVADIKFKGNKDLIQIIGADVDKIYLDMVHSISIDPEVIKRQKDLSIVYTPLHGAGRVLIPASLKEWGFENVNCVPEQMVKDGNFPTVVSPNPENAEALSMAIALAKKIDADIVMASDPDADRVGMACKDDKGEWVLINGNQTCLIFLYYIIKNRIAMGKMQPNDFIVKTIVTTELIKAVADKNKIEMRDCYTGFKWIAREIRLSEGKQQYIGGGEESYGFLAEDFVRDKDAVEVVVNGSWQTDNGEIELVGEDARTRERAVAANHNKGIDAVTFQRVVGQLAAFGSLELLATCGFEDGAAALDDVGYVGGGEILNLIGHQTAIAAVNTLYLESAEDAGTCHGADGGIHARSVAAGGEDAYALYFCHLVNLFV